MSIIEASTSAVHASATCDSGTHPSILNPHTGQAVCLSESAYATARYLISDIQDQLTFSGADIRTIITQNTSWLHDSYGSEALGISALVKNEVYPYAKALCAQDTRQPAVHIPGGKVYQDHILTPSCSVSGIGLSEFDITHTSIHFTSSAGEKTYRTSGIRFETTPVATTGSGIHTVTCSFRPHYCMDERTATRSVTVSAAEHTLPETYSIARQWNEVLLNAIRTDRVRPPVQARNLFHVSAALYDVWTQFHPENTPYLLNAAGKAVSCTLPPRLRTLVHTQAAEHEAMSYAAYRLIAERYTDSPGYATTMQEADALMRYFGYNTQSTSRRGRNASLAASLGNAIADCYIRYGLHDGSNEARQYANTAYSPRNPPLDPKAYGNPNLLDWDHWQPIALDVFIDQGGNEILGGAADFLAAEWGSVQPFSLRQDQKKTFTRDGHTYPVYLDPLPPPYSDGETLSSYIWNFALVAAWSSQLDTTDGTRIDISPATLGATAPLPSTLKEYQQFYDTVHGGTRAFGRPENPVTQQPYPAQYVLRGDYTRALAEFWADGPKSETPPGHWFYILNTISDNPMLAKKIGGQGNTVNDLEWDIKSYFTLGGAMHDAAIAAWGAKGWFDGIRPVSAIRAMGTLGQSTDPMLPSYHPKGLPLIPGIIELVTPTDMLSGTAQEHVGKVKIKTWKGPTAITDPVTDTAGVGWALAGNWWPYQRPSFVTPPFGGYPSGHSTYSRAAAEVLTSFTGTPYFPGGLYEVPIQKNAYLVFEKGPSSSFTFQWVTYQDAADACSLSRIWGGIHPPVDDIAGRILGQQIGIQAAQYAQSFFAH